MFEALTSRLSEAFSALTKKRLTEANIGEALQEVQRALLDSDVAFEVVQSFIEDVKAACIGQEVFKNVQPGQQVVKIVYDQLVAILGGQQAELDAHRPLSIMLLGLQGSGKTTTAAKLALSLKKKGEQPILVACDLYRPAAVDQLKQLGLQIDIPVLAYEQLSVLEIARKALAEANSRHASVIIWDTAGRLQIDAVLMAEAKQLKAELRPQETLLVMDSALGQAAVSISKTFQDEIGLTGVILTKLDGDAKCGAALSMKRSINVPIKFVGVGEKLDDLEAFYPDRLASRILGMGDVLTLVEKAQNELKQEDTQRLAKRLMDGSFDFNDFLVQIQSMEKMGMSRLTRLLPQIATLQLPSDHETIIKHQKAIVLSMTAEERSNPNLVISPYRRARILEGSGVKIADFNKLIKQFQMMKKTSRKLSKMDPVRLRGMMEQMGRDRSFLNNHQDLFK